MASIAERAPQIDVGASLGALLQDEGSARHPHLLRLAASEPGDGHGPDLVDAAHFLCLLHGRFPSVVDHAAERCADAATRQWMYRVTAAFAAERAFLTRLTMVAGPVPSTVGQARSESAAAHQAQALATLARSERCGTALGTAAALVLDWAAIRAPLDRAAARFGTLAPPLDLPPRGETLALLDAVTPSPGAARATLFGAQQLLVQHRGLWDLLDARMHARREA